MHTIEELLSLVSVEIDKEIELLYHTEPKNLYEPVGYALSMGGKRLRPVMVLLSSGIFSDNYSNTMPVAKAIELFHNFTLLHDDIMDRAEMRRNNLSVYKKYSENVAILSGDAMSIMAYNYLLKCQSANLPAIISLFSQTALEVCEGQQFDMDFETRLDVSIDEYLKMIRLKTAVLLACSLKIGALTTNAPTKAADQLYDFGLNLGIAFQLQDDLLDVFANQEKFGKKIGGDIVSNKKTFLLLKALELSSESLKATLLEWIGKTEFDVSEKVTSVTAIYNELGIKEITESHIEKYYQSAIKNLNDMDLPEEKKEGLFQLAAIIMNRDH